MHEVAPILDVRDLSINFGGVQALDSLTLFVQERAITGLIGPNGAGKTTLFNCISGLVRPNQGTISFRGVNIVGMPPHRRSLAGIGRTFQNVGLCKTETVFTNMMIAQHRATGYAAVPAMFGIGYRRREVALERRAHELLDMVGLAQLRHERVTDLPVGTAKNLELACILSSDPTLLLLDEPSSGLGPDESDHLREILLRVKEERDLSILMIGHDMRLVMNTAEYIYVLTFGRLLAEGVPQEIRHDAAVVAAYLGSQAVGDGKTTGGAAR